MPPTGADGRVTTPESGSFGQFLRVVRASVTPTDSDFVRAVYRSEVVRAGETAQLDDFMRGQAPFFYRDPKRIAQAFEGGRDFLKPIRDTLLRLPSADSFKESHFGEILAGVFAQHILGLRRLYSKLSLLTAENANAYKMDLVLYDPAGEGPVEFVMGEVKSSTKAPPDDCPPGHDTTCFASLFASFNKYKDADLEFDLSVVEDRLADVPPDDATRIRASLEPYVPTRVRYAGFCVIDLATYDDGEAQVLGSRRNKKQFNVDLLCVAELSDVAAQTYQTLEQLRSDVV